MLGSLRLIFTSLRAISVEPATIISSIAINIYAIASELGMYRVMCDKLFNVNNGTDLNDHQYFECWDTSVPLGTDLPNGTTWWEDAEIELQQRTTSWSMASALTSSIPSMIANLIWGAYSDHRGRKGVMLLGLAGAALYMVPIPILFWQPETTPVFICYIFNVITCLTGTLGVSITASAAYLTDTVKDKELLTMRMSILQICMSLGLVVGPLIGNALLDAVDYAWALVVAIGMMCVAFASALVMVKRVRPRAAFHNELDRSTGDQDVKVDQTKIIKAMDVEKRDLENERADAKRGCLGEMRSVVKEVPRLLAETWRTVVKRREGHHRAYIFVSAYVLFVFAAVDITFNGTVLTLYVQKEPLSWSQDQVSDFRSMANLIRLLGTLTGVFLFKKLLHMSDTFMIVLALASVTAQGVLISLSTTSWMLYLAASTGAFAFLSFPCVQAFVAKILRPDEVGKAYGALSLVTSLSYLFSSLVAGAIYHATVTFFPSLVFVVGTALLVSALCSSLWLYLDYEGGAAARRLKRMCTCGAREDVYQVQ